MKARTRGLALVISGPSGSGKSTIGRRLRRHPEVVFSVSCTTRAPREGEQDGVHYRFVDEASFRRDVAAGKFLEWAEVHGNLYGSPAEPMEAALAANRAKSYFERSPRSSSATVRLWIPDVTVSSHHSSP